MEEIVKEVKEVQLCRDPNDDFLLAICLDGEADFLVTGDKDLISLAPFQQTRVVTLSDFEKILTAQ